MYPPCLEVNKYLIPETRKRVAKELKLKGFKEKKIANILHISQGMVSRYISDEKSLYFNNEINEFSKKISNMIIENYTEQELTEFFCDFCISFRENKKFCTIHTIKNCDLCTYLYTGKRREEKNEISEKLKKAVLKLNNYNIVEIIPEVRMNIAYSRENPSSRMDVMAFPGRLTYFSGKIVYFSDPEFGASKHLSSILLNVKNKKIRAVINVKFNKKVFSKIKTMGMKYKIMERHKYSDVEDFVKELEDDFEIIVDPGTFGIEPMLYIFGNDPDDIVHKIGMLVGE
ncbi:MAG: thiamine-phosphate synthase family protein [Thermoplasmata archaeon]